MTYYRLRAMPPEVVQHPATDTGDAGNDLRDATCFALESPEVARHQPAGAVQVRLGIGKSIPRYWYYVGQVAYRSEEPTLARNDRVLLLGNDFTGANELRVMPGGWALDPAALDALLLGSLALIAPDLATGAPSAPVILELPGVGLGAQSPFWHGLGRHFYANAFPELTGNARGEWESHLASLLPRHPVVVSLLEAAAQAAIGTPADEAVPMLTAATRLGFRRTRQVRISDGGPVFEAPAKTFTFEAECAFDFTASSECPSRCVIRADDRQDAWIVPARRTETGLAIVEGGLEIKDSLRDRHWTFSFL